MMLVVKSSFSLLFPVFFLRLLILKLFLKSRIIVLIFHEIKETEINRFRILMQFIDKFFSFITPTEFEDFVHKKNHSTGARFLITFDDGFISSKNAINKVLDPMGVKAVLFICSEYIKKPESEVAEFIKDNFFFKADDSYAIKERWPLRNEDLVELHENGHKIGAHSVSHQVLSSITGEKLEKEVKEVKEDLCGLLNDKVEWFAYPFGGIAYINEESMTLIKNNYTYNFSGIRGEVKSDQDILCIPRCPVNIKATLITQLSEIVGVTNFFHKKKLNKIIKYKNQSS